MAKIDNQQRNLIAASHLFDGDWYRVTYDQAGDVDDPVEHYLTIGWRNGHSPSAQFDLRAYMSANPDVVAEGIEPLTHFLLHGQGEGRQMWAVKPEVPRLLLEGSPYFDADWYRDTYGAELAGLDPLSHYLSKGWQTGMSPGPRFDGPAYLEANPDVAAAGKEPLEHFLRHGLGEGRPLRPERDVTHRRLVEASGLFDPEWYARIYKTAVGSDDPLEHYLAQGWRRGFWPSPRFDAQAYLKANPDVAAAGQEPLDHFLRHGLFEGRKGVLFDARFPDMEFALPAEAASILLRTTPDREGETSLARLLAHGLPRFIVAHGKGRDVVEVGFRGAASLELLAALVAEGAASARILADSKPMLADNRLRLVADRLGVADQVGRYLKRFEGRPAEKAWQPIWTETAGNSWLIQSYFYERDLKNKLQRIDLLVALSSAFHAFEILHFFQRAAYLTDDYVLFDTPIIEPFEQVVDGVRVTFGPDDVWFAGHMSAAEDKAMAAYWTGRDVTLGQFANPQGGLTRQRVTAEKLGGVWWWFMGLGGLERLLDMAGLDIVERVSLWEGRSVAVLARKRRNPAVEGAAAA